MAFEVNYEMPEADAIIYGYFKNQEESIKLTDDGKIIINKNNPNFKTLADRFTAYSKMDEELFNEMAESHDEDWERITGSDDEGTKELSRWLLNVEIQRRRLEKENAQKSALQIVKSSNFGNVQCDFYKKDNEIWMTREQIGRALEYGNPNDAVYRIHERHKERLDKFSVIDKLSGTDGKAYDTYIYSAKGIYEICRWSQQPKADAFFDWVYDMLEKLRKGELVLQPQQIRRELTRPLPDKRQLEAEAKLINARTRQARLLLTTAEKFKDSLTKEEIRAIVVNAADMISNNAIPKLL